MSVTIQQDVAQTWHDAIIELFELDLEPITGSVSDKYYFTAGVMPDNSKMQWKGETYEPLPIEASGFERTTQGQIPTPELTVANVLGTLASVVNTLDDLVGAKVVRRRTLLKYLDNGTEPDSTQEFPEDIFYIERKVAETSVTITWQLASKIDLEGLQLPKRIITQNYCLWKYRGAECGYDGPPVANEYDQPIAFGGASSSEGQAYVAAYKAFSAASTKLANAEAKRNNLFGQKEAACLPGSADVEETAFVFDRTGIRNYSFVIEDGSGNPIIALWDGNTVRIDGSMPPYRPGVKQRTGRGPGNQNNGTGSAYFVELWSGSGANISKTVLPFSRSTFALRDGGNSAILFVDGQLVPQRAGAFATGYDIGDYAAEGFAPVRSIEKLDYNNAQCGTIGSSFTSADSAYNTALSEYNAAKSALDAAAAALPVNDDVLRRDRCGKRLQSCRLRFGLRGALPFGGFPGANLTR